MELKIIARNHESTAGGGLQTNEARVFRVSCSTFWGLASALRPWEGIIPLHVCMHDHRIRYLWKMISYWYLQLQLLHIRKWAILTQKSMVEDSDYKYDEIMTIYAIKFTERLWTTFFLTKTEYQIGIAIHIELPSIRKLLTQWTLRVTLSNTLHRITFALYTPVRTIKGSHQIVDR